MSDKELSYDIYSEGWLMASSADGPVHALPVGHYLLAVNAPGGDVRKDFEISSRPVELEVPPTKE